MKLSYPVDNFLKKAANDNRLLPSHISLFMALFFYSPDYAPEGSFRVCRRKLMRFARIKSVATYHKCIRELARFGYVVYSPSFDPYRASTVTLVTATSEAVIPGGATA
jgi:hypothetical protein